MMAQSAAHNLSPTSATMSPELKSRIVKDRKPPRGRREILIGPTAVEWLSFPGHPRIARLARSDKVRHRLIP